MSNMLLCVHQSVTRNVSLLFLVWLHDIRINCTYQCGIKELEKTTKCIYRLYVYSG